MRQWDEHLNSGVAKLARFTNTPVECSSAGSRVRSDDGRDYINCGGFGVFTLGHSHPEVVAAVCEQVRRHPLRTHVLLPAEPAAAAADLAQVAPPGLDCVLFTNSGAEAAEVALKLASLSGRRRIVAAEGGFHGKTLGALGVTGRGRYREPFEHWLLPAQFARFGDLDSFERALAGGTGESCVIVEPILGEGGVKIPPPGFLRGLRELCDRRGALLIADEVQTGMGRTGTWWAVDHEQVAPDLLLAGKALGGGVAPVAAVAATRSLFKPLNEDPWLHTSTFGSSPLATAAVSAAIAVSRSIDVCSRARAVGTRLLDALRAGLGESGELFVDIRGKGLLIGLEFRHPHEATAFALEMQRHGVLVCFSAQAHEVVRLTPPAVLTEAEGEEVVAAAAAAARAMLRGRTRRRDRQAQRPPDPSTVYPEVVEHA